MTPRPEPEPAPLPRVNRAELERYYRRGFARAFGRLVHAFCRVWFRYQFRHPGRIPTENVLFIGNHGGLGVAEVLCMLGAWTRRFDGGRRAVALTHQATISLPLVGRIARAIGAVPAGRDMAVAALALGYDVLCFPGGDLDSCRPFWEARRVCFGNRRGYVRIALECGVPIVPVASFGGHLAYLLLPGGFWLAKVAGTKKWARIERFPFALGGVLALTVTGLAAGQVLPWWSVLVAVVAAIIPNPVRVTIDVLPPIDVSGATAAITDIEARVEAAHELVQGAIAARVASMRHD